MIRGAKSARTVAALLFCVSATLPALAQEISPLEPPDTTRYLRWGPLRVRPGLTIPTLGYDNNVYYRPDESPLPQVGDYFIAIAPRVDGIVLFGSRAFLTFSERLEFYVYAKEHEVDYFNQFGRARVTVPFGNYGFYVDGGYDRIRDRPVESDDVRPIRKEIPFGVGAILKFGWRTDVELGYAHNRYTGEDPDDPCPGTTDCFTIDQRVNRVEDGLKLNARYVLFGRTRLTLAANARDIVFDDPAVQRDGRERRLIPGLDFGLGGRIYGKVRVGWAYFNLENPLAEDFRGVVADAALGYRMGGYGSSVGLTGVRDVRYSVLESTDLYRYSNLDLNFVRYFNRFIGMELGGGRGSLDFLGDPLDRKDDLSNGLVGVRFRLSETDLGRRVEYAFRYVLTRRNSNLDYLDQTRGTIGFGLSYGY